MEDDILAPICMKLPPADDLMELLEAAAGFAPVGLFLIMFVNILLDKFETFFISELVSC